MDQKDDAFDGCHGNAIATFLPDKKCENCDQSGISVILLKDKPMNLCLKCYKEMTDNVKIV